MMVITNMAVEKVRNYLGWTVVGKGRKKESLQLTSCEAHPIPVICHCFERLNNFMNHEVILLTYPCHGKGTEPMQTKTDLRTGKNIKY